jgi:hypothetical protein
MRKIRSKGQGLVKTTHQRNPNDQNCRGDIEQSFVVVRTFRHLTNVKRATPAQFATAIQILASSDGERATMSVP